MEWNDLKPRNRIIQTPNRSLDVPDTDMYNGTLPQWSERVAAKETHKEE